MMFGTLLISVILSVVYFEMKAQAIDSNSRVAEPIPAPGKLNLKAVG